LTTIGAKKGANVKVGVIGSGDVVRPTKWCIPGFARKEWRHAFKLLK
jgi:hypothetical protein